MAEGFDEEYKFDKFDDGGDRLVYESHSQKLKKFYGEYTNQLLELQVAIDETLGDVWDAVSEPLQIDLTAFEAIKLEELVSTSDKDFDETVSTISSLCLEMETFQRFGEKEYFAPYSLYGEEFSEDIKMEVGDCELQMSRMLLFMDHTFHYIKKAYEFVVHVVRQLAKMYPGNSNFNGVHLQVVYEHLGKMLSFFIKFDCIIAQSSVFKEHFSTYKRVIKAVRADRSRFQVEEDKLDLFEKYLLSIEGAIVDGRTFAECLEQEYDIPGVLDIRSNKAFLQEFVANIRAYFAYLSSRIGEPNEYGERNEIFGCFGLFALYYKLSRDMSDKKFLKSMFELHKKLPILHVYGPASWYPTEFLLDNIPYLSKLLGDGVLAAQHTQKAYIKTLDEELPRDVQRLHMECSIWMVRFESQLSETATSTGALSLRRQLFHRGLALAYRCDDLIRDCLSLHLSMGVPLKTSIARGLCQLLEIVQAIRMEYFRRTNLMAAGMTEIVQHITLAIQCIIFPIKQKLESRKSKSHVLASVCLLMDVLGSGLTKQRRIVASVCLSVIQRSGVVKDSDIDDIKRLLRELDRLGDHPETMASICECSYIYFNRVILTSYFYEIFVNPEQAHKMQYLLNCLQGSYNMLCKAKHLEDDKQMINAFVKEVETDMYEMIVKPLCTVIENDLRLHIHSQLGVDSRDLWKQGLKDVSRFLTIKPLRFFDKKIDLKLKVTHYLDSTFYNLTTVALHDWMTYEEMRNLALQKYDLHLTEVHLPEATLEQGLDMLEIMRNIHIFVSKYCYNLNMQMYMEKESDSKFLNSISIRHIANSIRTHGTGIMNTAVNFTYQFLVKKFHIFSQFLFDDHIKSRLIKDVRYFKDNRTSLLNMYPYDRASKFNKEIRKLGVTDSGETFLGQFRLLITEIGNAMGFIRMIRSGGIHYIANAIKFVPDLNSIPDFEYVCENEGLSPESQQAAKNLDSVIDNLATTFSEGSEYFKLLVDVFKDEFRASSNLHLKNFYMIIAPLSINYVDKMLILKDRLTKTKKRDVTMFTDDGFALGLAYILRLLDQNESFDAIHWFERVNVEFAEQTAKVQEEIATLKKTKKDATLLAQASLTLEKKRNNLREFELFRYSFSAARIFFRE